MTSHGRFLKSATSTTTSPPSTASPADNVDSDFVVILAALLCALICVLGLVAVARCAWLRRFTAGAAATAPANKGLKKKVLKSLPKTSYSADHHAGKLSDDCAICLSDFVSGDQIRVLPQCGHGFHVACIDTWLGSHSSCPSCRQILAVRCHKCGGGLPNSSGACSDAPPPTVEDSSFLP
ncbi:hypothetical protein RND81_01G111200 [Saponaria officinalis]|uniref:RING-type domain-containing protein n=1 Tax=Saponaria officinalis TaxID=3572 RepID=A0AAW1NEC2_SAPOF